MARVKVDELAFALDLIECAQCPPTGMRPDLRLARRAGTAAVAGRHRLTKPPQPADSLGLGRRHSLRWGSGEASRHQHNFIATGRESPRHPSAAPQTDREVARRVQPTGRRQNL